jgi:hypothetical protein
MYNTREVPDDQDESLLHRAAHCLASVWNISLDEAYAALARARDNNYPLRRDDLIFPSSS